MRYTKKSTKFQPRENRALTSNNRPSVSAPFKSAIRLQAKHAPPSLPNSTHLQPNAAPLPPPPENGAQEARS